MLLVKNLPASAGDTRDVGLIPGLGRSPRVGNGNSLQYSCLENSMDRGAWWAIAHGVTKSRTRLSTHALQLALTSSVTLGKLSNLLGLLVFHPEDNKRTICMRVK